MRRYSLIRKIKGHFLFLLSLGVFAMVSWGLSAQLMKRYTVNQELQRLEMQARDIERENATLEQFIAYTKTTAFIEREARLKKGLQREGEETVVVRGIQKDSDRATERNQTDTRSNPVKWFDYFIEK